MDEIANLTVLESLPFIDFTDIPRVLVDCLGNSGIVVDSLSHMVGDRQRLLDVGPFDAVSTRSEAL